MAKKPPGKRSYAPKGMIYARNWNKLPQSWIDELKTRTLLEYTNKCFEAGENALPVDRLHVTVQLTQVGINVRIWEKEKIDGD